MFAAQNAIFRCEEKRVVPLCGGNGCLKELIQALFLEDCSGCYGGRELTVVEMIDPVAKLYLKLLANEPMEIRNYVWVFGLVGQWDPGRVFPRSCDSASRSGWRVIQWSYPDFGRFSFVVLFFSRVLRRGIVLASLRVLRRACRLDASYVFRGTNGVSFLYHEGRAFFSSGDGKVGGRVVWEVCVIWYVIIELFVFVVIGLTE